MQRKEKGDRGSGEAQETIKKTEGGGMGKKRKRSRSDTSLHHFDI